ncbi:MAG TPA: MFS transporter [Humibacter sp.]|nr:MFS transporter [Humibacter sp.]
MSGAFTVPAFRRLWTAGLVSDAGDWLLFIALPLVVYRITGSALGTSIAFLLELAPAVLLAPIAARLVGRFDRRRLMVTVNAGQAVVLLPLLVVHTAAQLPIAYAVIAAQAALGTVFEPAKNALLPDLVASDQLISANALVGLNQNLGRLVGGPAGGVLLALGDLELVVAVDALSYFVSAVLIASVPIGAVVGPHADGAAMDAAPNGLLAALSIRRLWGAYAVVFVSSIAQGMFLVLFVLFVLNGIHGSDADVGLLRGIQAIGAIGAGVALGFLTRSGSARTLTTISLFTFGAVSLVTWNLPLLTTSIAPYVVLFVLVGAPGVIFSTGLISTLQQESTARQRGAVFATIGMLSAVGQAVGILAAGLVDGPVPLTALLQVQGCLYLASGIIAATWLPRLTSVAQAAP